MNDDKCPECHNHDLYIECGIYAEWLGKYEIEEVFMDKMIIDDVDKMVNLAIEKTRELRKYLGD